MQHVALVRGADMSNSALYSRGDKMFVMINMFLIAVFTISTLYPFIYITAVSFSSGFQAAAGNVVLGPIDATLAAYKYTLARPEFWISYKNTFIYTIGGTLTSLAFIIPGAYALSRKNLFGRRFWNLLVAFTMWFNALRNFFEGVPQSFEEAAKMDGANEFQILWKVYVPLAKPAIATVALFCVVSRWNGFFWAMILLQDRDKVPLQVFLRHVITDLQDTEEFSSTLLHAPYSFQTVSSAIIVCSIIPVLIFYPFIQKYFDKGIMLGGVKE